MATLKLTLAVLLAIIYLIVAPQFTPVVACLNEIGRNTVGQEIYFENLTPEEFMKSFTTHPDKTYWTGVLKDLQIADDPRSRSKTNNFAVALLHLGRTAEAIEILKAIELEEPGIYHTATNLGTAYELNGENAKALEWIKEGITRNPDSHNGSEWLHVKILEAKIALEKDPKWLETNSVVGINKLAGETLTAAPTTVDHLGKTLDAKAIEDALVYQLHERLEFIKPPEGVVANLLFDLSRIMSMRKSDDHGAALWVFAQRYGADLMPWLPHEAPLPALVVPPSYLDLKYVIGGSVGMAAAILLIVGLIVRRRRTGTQASRLQ